MQFLAPHSDSPSKMPPPPLDPSRSPVDLSQSPPPSAVDMSQSPPPSPVDWSPSLPLSPVDSSWSPSPSEEEREQNSDNGENSPGGHGSISCGCYTRCGLWPENSEHGPGFTMYDSVYSTPYISC